MQECRLLDTASGSLPWEPRVCSICSVPDILRANSCSHMRLQAKLVRRLLRKKVEVKAFCTKRQVPVENPYIGCGHCHPDAASVLMPEGQ